MYRVVDWSRLTVHYIRAVVFRGQLVHRRVIVRNTTFHMITEIEVEWLMDGIETLFSDGLQVIGHFLRLSSGDFKAHCSADSISACHQELRREASRRVVSVVVVSDDFREKGYPLTARMRV